MKNSKDDVTRFFDGDSSDYLKHQYADTADSFMSLRRNHAGQLIRGRLAPEFNESFRFLDAGCGPGILLEIVGNYPIRYWGVDISEEMLELARRQAQSCPSQLFRGQFLKGDVESVPFESGSFDAAASLGVIEYLNDDDRLLAEMARVTTPKGFVLVAVTNRFSYNLLFEKLIIWLRRGRLTSRIISYLKTMLKRGEFKPREFAMRRHSPSKFVRKLEEHGFKVIESRFWGFNFLPYPFNYLCGRALNRFSNRLYDKTKFKPFKSLGEGFMVLCQKRDSGAV